MTHQDETDQARSRDFVIILDLPQVKSFTLPAAEYDLICLATEETDHIEDAIQSIEAKWEDDNPVVRQSAIDMFLRLARMDPETDKPTQLMMERATHRLRLILEARKNDTLHQSQKGYTVYQHPGLLKNPHVWIVDGTADLILKDSKYWTIVKESDYNYHLVCPCPPIIADINMIDRNLKKTLTSADGGMSKAYQIVQDWMGAVLEFLDSLAHQHTKILVIFWKDFKDTASLKPPETTPLVQGNTLDAVENGLIRFFMQKVQELPLSKFEFSPYGIHSLTDSKGKTIDAVVFIGKFYLPQPAIEDINRANGTHTSRNLYSLAEVVNQTFRSRCQFGEPVTIYFTPDYSKDDIQKFLVYTNARDLDGQPLSIFTREELLEEKLRKMGFDKRQIHHLSNIVKTYPEFEDNGCIEFSTQKAKKVLGKSNIRDIREMLENWQNKGVHITLLS
jgi:hypothetical protein